MQESTQTKSDYRLKELESRLGFVDLGRLIIAKPLIQRIIIDSVNTETALNKEKQELNTQLSNTRDELLDLTNRVKNELNPKMEKLRIDLEIERKTKLTAERLKNVQLAVLGSIAFFQLYVGGNPTNMEVLFTYYEKIQQTLEQKKVTWEDFRQCFRDFLDYKVIEPQDEGSITKLTFPFPLHEAVQLLNPYFISEHTRLRHKIYKLQEERRQAYDRGVLETTQKFENQITGLQTTLNDYEQKLENPFPSEQARIFYNLLKNYSGEFDLGVTPSGFNQILKTKHPDMKLTSSQVDSILYTLTFLGLAEVSGNKYKALSLKKS